MSWLLQSAGGRACSNGKQVLAGAGLPRSRSGEVTCGEQTPGLVLVFVSVLRQSWTLETSRIAKDSRPGFSASHSGSLARLVE